jgi:hypothetical protein
MSIPATMTAQISEAKKLEISYRVLHPSAILKDEYSSRNIEIPFSSLTNKYRDFLNKIVKTIELDDKLIARYRYRPKMVSYDLYETTELWNDILILNHCFSTYEFQPKKISVYDPSSLKEYINEILILEGLI